MELCIANALDTGDRRLAVAYRMSLPHLINGATTIAFSIPDKAVGFGCFYTHPLANPH